jgi:hypothetical protein
VEDGQAQTFSPSSGVRLEKCVVRDPLGRCRAYWSVAETKENCQHYDDKRHGFVTDMFTEGIVGKRFIAATAQHPFRSKDCDGALILIFIAALHNQCQPHW